VREGIDRYGVVYDFRYGWLWAYEADGYGNYVLMDDANLPNLISATFFNFTWPDDPLYRDTREFSLSTDDPYFYRGAYAVGLGSSHTPTGWVWPLGMTTRALTARTWGEVAQTLAQLRATGGSEAIYHESLDPDHPWRFTRTEFGWANALYAELVFRSVAGYAALDPPSPWYASPLRTPQLPDPVQRWRNAATIMATGQQIFASL
jgi:meiotically up-regulated gene 157 (Mug157) protein